MDGFEERKKGHLPEVDIAGDRFLIDVRLAELRHVDTPWKRLPLDQMVPTEDHRHYQFFYNRELKSVFHASQELTDIPEHVVLVEIPDEMQLDPVGMARKLGLSDAYFLSMHPYQKQIKARVTPVEESGLPDLVLNNHRMNPAKSIKR
ncbi:hypothetical protein FHS59_000108 [Algoriphagus iocasae]|uniref:Uncharacterized protein n=1 Tax=Algoriphagus iocasae TaxID=1836499 RepID=A0A841MCP8_9BACT|nr:hypothetical protein [Algoriphagus iocasae]MBB6324493.1 hypothetical protein [Algoriphagus iocasae]